MRIIDNTNTSVEFSAIKIGDCFYYDNCLFIKINPVKEEHHTNACNAFCFADNNIASVPQNWIVTPVEAEVIIRSRGVRE